MKHFNYIAAGLLALAATHALAQDQEKKLSFGVELGWATPTDTGNVSQSLVAGLGGTATSSQDSGATVGRVFAAYAFTENIGAELGYLLSNDWRVNFSGTTGGGVGYSGNTGLSISGADLALVLRPSKSTGKNGLFLKLGGTSYTEKFNYKVTTGVGVGAGNASETGAGSLVGLGYDLPLRDHVQNST
jgi:hypothetical protein